MEKNQENVGNLKKHLTSRITIDPLLSSSFVLFRSAQSSTKAVLSRGRVYEALESGISEVASVIW